MTKTEIKHIQDELKSVLSSMKFTRLAQQQNKFNPKQQLADNIGITKAELETFLTDGDAENDVELKLRAFYAKSEAVRTALLF